MERTDLPHGCYIGKMSVFPANWKSKSASVKQDWRIQYRFYDPVNCPKGVLKVIKGMNCFKNLDARRTKTSDDIANMLLILQGGYNPITKQTVPEAPEHETNPYTPLFTALEWARQNATVVDRMKKDIKSQLKYLQEAAVQLGYLKIPIGEVRRKHIIFLINQVGKNRPIWNNGRFNKYRANLQSLFKVLLQIEAVEGNIITPIERKPVIKKIRETLSKEQRRLVDNHLRAKKKTAFRLYARIFFHSGIRSTELLRVKAKDVNLKDQLLRATIIKGYQYQEVDKTIKSIAVRYWKLALKNCKPDEYVFSKSFKPGSVLKDENDISVFWNKHVKKPLGITADFYAFKHGNTTEMVGLQGEEVAAGLNSHTSTAMVRQIYDTKRISREHERIKQAGNEF